MPSAIPAAMLTELEGQARVHFTFDIALANASGGTTAHRFAEAAIASESEGLYLPYVTRFGSLRRSSGFPTFGFQNPRTSVSVFDLDRELQKAIGGPASGKVLGSAANVVMRSFHVPAASHYTVLPGVVKDFSLSGERTWEFVIGPDIEAFETKLKIPRLAEMWDQSSLPESTRRKPGRLIWGEWLSSGRSSVGLIEVFLVDETNKYWFVTNGHLPDSSITDVFVDDVEDTVDWTQVRLLRNGNPVTVIRYDGGSAYTEGNTIRIDCTGLGDQGDGQPVETLERLPSEALALTLVNFAFNKWPENGVPSASLPDAFRWSTAADEIDASSVSAAGVYHELLNHEIAAIWTSDQTPQDILSEYMSTFFVSVFFGDEFKLKIGTLKLQERDIYTPDFIRQDEHDVVSISGESFGEDRISQGNVSYMPDGSDGFDRTFTATNRDLDYFKEADIDLTVLGPSRVP